MAENLNYETNNSWWYNDNHAYGEDYGRLYTWDAAINACPDGWHLPNEDEWCILAGTVDATVDCNGMGYTGTDFCYELKSTQGWLANGNGSDAFGFNVLPAGYRHPEGSFMHVGKGATFWSLTEYSSTEGLVWDFWYELDLLFHAEVDKEVAISVRCIKED